MQKQTESIRHSEGLIKKLLSSISEATEFMSSSFQQTILRHEEQFVKCYRLKIVQLVKMFEQLKATIQDKFINNTLAIQLDNVIKERDYFKYECLKLNSQFQTLNDDYKNLTAQANNSSEQITIYRHLLENEKLKSNQIEANVEDLKRNLAQISLKSINCVRQQRQHVNNDFDRDFLKLRKQLKDKNQLVRALKEKLNEYQKNLLLTHERKIQKKQLYQLFKVCVQGWKRQLELKNNKQQRKLLTPQQLSTSSKKELLRLFFTHIQFLKFIEKLMFDDGFKVTFESTEQKYMEKNRVNLHKILTKKNFYSTSTGFR